MDHDWQTELAALTHMGVSALRGKYAELFGEPTRTGNKTWLVRRIAWWLQALAQGDLSERARRRAEELARDADLRLTAPHGVLRVPPAIPERNKPTLKLRSEGSSIPRYEMSPTLPRALPLITKERKSGSGRIV